MTTETETKKSKDTYGSESRSNIHNFDPDKLVIVTDPLSPLYDERHKLAVDENLVKNINYHGILEPVLVRKNPETGVVEVVAGRQRVKAAREINRRRREEGGEPLFVPTIVRRGDDASVTSAMASENELRTSDDPMNRARKMQRLVQFGKSETEIGVVFGCTAATVKNTLSLLECTNTVRRAVEAGKIKPSVAYQLAKQTPEEQNEKVAAILAATSEETVEVEEDDDGGDIPGTETPSTGKGKKRKNAKKAAKKVAKKVRGRKVNQIVSGNVRRGTREIRSMLESAVWKTAKTGEVAKAALEWVLGNDRALDDHQAGGK